MSRAPVLILSGERVLCPHLHPLPDTTVELPHGLRQCRHTAGNPKHGRPYGMQGETCGVWLWVFRHGDGTRTVVPLLDEQAHYIREHPLMTVLQIRDFLGMRWVAA